MIQNINLQEILDAYVIPWGINIVLAVLIFVIGKKW